MERLPKMTQDELNQRIASGNYVLFFTADWCPDCNFIKPAMPVIEQDFTDYTFLLVDRDENIDLAADLGIMGIPSFVVYQDGTEVGRFVNKDRKTKEQVENFLKGLN
ncbi:thioredoxin family protein [uncultured Limosilactobacillus sp.]|uniref:thioredoxin family protein n=1 Tax=uncultured Limosilactobacillus sp. TaxID=2837629 RepID=UPI0025F1317F|nr:thioredoxin family protein [uncultured Limosilactobacillus sp.]